MKHKEIIQKKKWIKPELKAIGFKRTFGGVLSTYPEIEGGTVS